MMNLTEIANSAGGIGNMLRAGLPLSQALTTLAQTQREYADHWNQSAASVQSGQMLSESLKEIWPATLVGAVQAGELSGTLDAVFERIEETIELRQKLQSEFMKLAYPFGIALAGLVVFFGFMIFVLPSMSRSLETRSGSRVFQLSQWMSDFAHANWLPTVIALGAGLFVLINWLRTEAAKEWIIEVALGIPILKDALRDMLFGLWANYMAMVVTAGIPTTEALRMTAILLPAGLHDSVVLFEKDLSVHHRSMSDAVNVNKLDADDPRVIWWPMYILNAFKVAEQTGTIDKELLRVAPSLIKQGSKTLKTCIEFSNAIGLCLAAFLAVSPLGAYYVEMFAALSSAGR